MAGIDTSFAQTKAQRVAAADKKRKAQAAAQARADAARKASVQTFAPPTPPTRPAGTPAAPVRSSSPGLRQRFKNVIRSTQSARNQVIDKAVSDSVNATETGRRQRRKVQ